MMKNFAYALLATYALATKIQVAQEDASHPQDDSTMEDGSNPRMEEYEMLTDTLMYFDENEDGNITKPEFEDSMAQWMDHFPEHFNAASNIMEFFVGCVEHFELEDGDHLTRDQILEGVEYACEYYPEWCEQVHAIEHWDHSDSLLQDCYHADPEQDCSGFEDQYDQAWEDVTMLEPLFEEEMEDIDLGEVEGELHDRFMDISKKMEEGETDEWDLVDAAIDYDEDLYDFSWEITYAIDDQIEHLQKSEYCEEDPEDEWCEESDSSDDSSDESSDESSDDSSDDSSDESSDDSSDDHKDTSDDSSDDHKDTSQDEDEADEADEADKATEGEQE